MFDRGSAGAPWLLQALEARVRFIVRWKKGNDLLDAQGERHKASEISRKKRSIDHVQLETAVVAGTHYALPGGKFGVDKPHFLGPTIFAQKDRPVRITFYNAADRGRRRPVPAC